MKRRYFTAVLTASITAIALVFTSCLDSDGETIPLEFDANSVIPSDDLASENPDVEDDAAAVSNFIYQFTYETRTDSMLVEIVMPGVKYPDSDQWLYAVGTNGSAVGTQNVWVSVDDKPRGCRAYNYSAGETEDSLTVDFVFLVDNSSNMNAAGDLIASDVRSWAKTLAKSAVELRVGVVGYGGSETDLGVDGAMDLCTASELEDYLNLDDATGVSRTKGYGGDYATYLEKISAISFSNCSGECGVEALMYANSAFTFAENALRVYLNFTDEANQPGGESAWSVEQLADQQTWSATAGVVHTVFSGNEAFSEQELAYEWPWKMSTYTGGTTLVADNSLTDVTLTGLDVTGTLQNWWVIRFRVPSSLADDEEHTVHITILSTDEQIQADKTFQIAF